MPFRRYGLIWYFLVIISFIIIIIIYKNIYALNELTPTEEFLSVIKKTEKFRILSNKYSSVKMNFFEK